MLRQKILLVIIILILILLPAGGIFFVINSFKLFNAICEQKKYPINNGVIISNAEMVFIGIGNRPKVKVQLNDGTIIKLILLSDLKDPDSKEISFNVGNDPDKTYYYFRSNEYLLLFFGIIAIIAVLLFVFIVYKTIIKKTL